MDVNGLTTAHAPTTITPAEATPTAITSAPPITTPTPEAPPASVAPTPRAPSLPTSATHHAPFTPITPTPAAALIAATLAWGPPTTAPSPIRHPSGFKGFWAQQAQSTVEELRQLLWAAAGLMGC